MKNLRTFIKYQLPAIIFALVIFIQSSFSQINVPNFGFSFQDKIAHTILFGILGFLITRAFYFGTNDTLRKNAIVLGILVGTLYALSDEIHQLFVPGRSADIIDVLADFVGIIVAQLFFVYKRKFA